MSQNRGLIPPGDAGILLILRPGQADARGTVFKTAPPLQMHRLSRHGSLKYGGANNIRVSSPLGVTGLAGGKKSGKEGEGAGRAHLHFKSGAAKVPRAHKTQSRQQEETQGAPLTFNQPEYLRKGKRMCGKKLE